MSDTSLKAKIQMLISQSSYTKSDKIYAITKSLL